MVRIYVDSDDGFIYFRHWLLLKGKQFFEDIEKDIQSFVSGKYNFNSGDFSMCLMKHTQKIMIMKMNQK